MKRLLLVAALAAAASAQAGEVLFHTVSAHGSRTYDHDVTTKYIDEHGQFVKTETVSEVRNYNNTNFGIGYRFDNEVAVGIYRNSYYWPSAYVSYMPLWQTPVAPLKAGFVVVATSGYEQQTGHKISIAAAFAAGYKITDKTTAYGLFTPKVSDGGVAVVHLMFGQEF
jgi:hypothetical protein